MSLGDQLGLNWQNALLDLLGEIDSLSKGRLLEIQEVFKKSATPISCGRDEQDINLDDFPRLRELFEEHQKGLSFLDDSFG